MMNLLNIASVNQFYVKKNKLFGDQNTYYSIKDINTNFKFAKYKL